MAGFISRFNRNQNGNFALVFACAFPALIASVAFGLDISNTLTTKTEMQDANDSAVLLAARYFKEKRKQPPLKEIQAFLDGNSTVSMKAQKLVFNASRSEFTLESNSKVNTLLMGYFGSKYQNYEVVSKSNLGFSETLQFALALDTTGSMASDNKMDGLKVAANDFIDAMFDAKDRGADIKGGIVPFAQYVNVGLSRKAEPWLNVPKDIDTRVTTSTPRKHTPVIGTNNCRTVCYPASTVDYPAEKENCKKSDGVKTCTPGKPAHTVKYDASCNNMCDPIYGPEETIVEDITTGTLITWQGCVGSRDYPLNVQDRTYGKKIPGLMDVACGVEIQPLTAVRSTLKDTIASLTPDGETYLPEGVMWGTRLLTKQAPFTEGKPTGKGGRQVRKVLVLMTDGENTLAPDGAYHTKTKDTDPLAIEDANRYTAEACDEAKLEKLEIFTISFGNTVPQVAKDLLLACATAPENYYNATSSADLKSAFENIANDLLNVRLSQ